MLKEEALQVLTQHRFEFKKLGVKSLAVFGSVVRGNAKPDSDVDVLVEFDRPVGLIAFLQVRYRLEELLKRRVDLVTPGSLKKQLRDRILAEAEYAG